MKHGQPMMRLTGISRTALWIALGLACAFIGCSALDDARRGYPIASGPLGEVGVVDLRDLSTTLPSTLPSTRAATVPTTLPIPAPPAEITLTIEQCRQWALANNLELRVELFNPTLSKQAISEEEARYEAVFTGRAGYSIIDSPVFSRINSAQSKGLTTDAGIKIPLRTGGSIGVDLGLSKFESDNEFTTLNPAYSSTANASLSLPLLRGAGIAVNAIPLRLAVYDYQSAQARTKLEVIRVLADAERIYWRLYAARREQDVRRKEFDLAVAQMERARRQVKAGAAAEVEVVRAESGVADRVEAVIDAENRLRQRQREMKRVLSVPEIGLSSPTIILPSTPPDALYYRLDSAQLVRTAMGKRMEMLDEELSIARQSASIDLARNDLLPLVSLDYTYSVGGLGGTTSDAFQVLRSKRFENHTIGLSVEVPIGNDAARSRLRRSLAGRLQALASKENRASLIEKEVLDAADQLDVNWQRILAAQRRVVLAARVVDQETRQFIAGLRTSTDVLDAQARLADAQSSEIAALTEYQIAQIDIAFATGTLLGRSKVVWQAAPPPRD